MYLNFYISFTFPASKGRLIATYDVFEYTSGFYSDETRANWLIATYDVFEW